MKHYSPINIYRLNKKARELLNKIEQQILWSPRVLNISLAPAQFDLFLEGIPEDIRKDYQNKIPYKGKNLVRVGK